MVFHETKSLEFKVGKRQHNAT